MCFKILYLTCLGLFKRERKKVRVGLGDAPVYPGGFTFKLVRLAYKSMKHPSSEAGTNG